MIEGYNWAENRFKLQRAIDELKEKGLEASDEAVKEVYVRMLGRVLEIKDGEVELEDLRVADLKKLAEGKGIEVNGLKKDELIEALRA